MAWCPFDTFHQKPLRIAELKGEMTQNKIKSANCDPVM